MSSDVVGAELVPVAGSLRSAALSARWSLAVVRGAVGLLASLCLAGALRYAASCACFPPQLLRPGEPVDVLRFRLYKAFGATAEGVDLETMARAFRYLATHTEYQIVAKAHGGGLSGAWGCVRYFLFM